MIITYLPAREGYNSEPLWVARSERKDAPALKAAGFFWHPFKKSGSPCRRSRCQACAAGVDGQWWTTEAAKACRIVPQYGDEAAKAACDGVDVSEKARELVIHYVPEHKVWVALSERHHTPTLREAGWSWHPFEGSDRPCTRKGCPMCAAGIHGKWYTTDRTLACRLAQYADESTKPTCEAQKQAIAESEATTVSDAVVIPAPPGLKYRPYQLAGIAYALAREGTLNADDMGLGKQHAVDAKLLTPAGWVEFGGVKVGDKTIGSDGKSTRISGVFPQGVKPSYRVRFSDGSSVEAGPEHLWTVAYWRGGRHLTEMTLTTDQLRLRPVIGKLDLSKTKLFLPMLAAPVEFSPQVALPVPPYTLGQLIANGALGDSSAILTSNTADWPEVQRRVEGEGVRVGFVHGYGGATQACLLGQIGLARSLGLAVGSREKFIPRQYLLASPEHRIALLQGLMDGDGSISKTRNRVTYHSISPQLVKDVQELVECLGGIASVRSYDRSAEGKPLEFQVRIRLPAWVPPFSTSRKLERYHPGRLALPVRSVVAVEYVRDVESVCIAVEAEDHLYATEHAILTHNTIQTMGVVNGDETIETVLVISPASLRINWSREAQRWSVRPIRITVIDETSEVVWDPPNPQVEMTIVNYDRLIDQAGTLKRKKLQADREGLVAISKLVEATAALKLRAEREGQAAFARSPLQLVLSEKDPANPRKKVKVAYTPKHPGWAGIIAAEQRRLEAEIPVLEAALKDHRTVLEDLMARKWDFLVCDEAQAIKNPEAQRTIAVLGDERAKSKVEGLKDRARRVLFLTGTPIDNRPIEVWPLAHALDPENFSEFFKFAKRYCDAKNEGFGWDFSGASNLGELREKLRSTCLVASTVIDTEDGPRTIGELVSGHIPVRVWSRDSMGRLSLQPVVGHSERAHRGVLVRISFGGGSIVCTPDHRVFTQEAGWTRADSCSVGDHLRHLLPQERTFGSAFGGAEAICEDGMGLFPVMRREVVATPTGLGVCRTQGGDPADSLEDVRAVRQGVRGQKRQGVPATPFLHFRMSRHVGLQADERSLSANARGSREAFCQNERGSEAGAWRKAAGAEGQSGSQASHVGGSSSTVEGHQGIRGGVSAAPQSPGARKLIGTSRLGTFGALGGSGASGGSGRCAARSEWQDDLRGHPACGAEADRRSGRFGTWSTPGTSQRQSQGRRDEPTRILNVEILEVGCRGEIAGSGDDYSRVYDIEVARNHNFFANGVLVHNCMIRRRKEDVLDELPPIQHQLVVLPADTPALKAALAAEKALGDLPDRQAEAEADLAIASAMNDAEAYKAAVAKLNEVTISFESASAVRQKVALAKLEMCTAYIDDMLESGISKIIVFAHHKAVLEALKAHWGDRAVLLFGETKMADRQLAVDRFQTDPTCQVFVASIRAAGVGLTLTAAADEIFVEQDWAPGKMSQAWSRAHRMGQTRKVNVRQLVVNGSIDATMAKMLVDKQAIFDAALDTPTDISLVAPPPPPGADIPMPEFGEPRPEIRAGRGAELVAGGQESDGPGGLRPKTRLGEAQRVLPNEEVAPVSGEMKDAARTAMQIITEYCDGARKLDDMGFSKMDASLGRKLAAMPEYTDKVAHLAIGLARKYRRQLPGDLVELLGVGKGMKPARRKEGEEEVAVETGPSAPAAPPAIQVEAESPPVEDIAGREVTPALVETIVEEALENTSPPPAVEAAEPATVISEPTPEPVVASAEVIPEDGPGPQERRMSVYPPAVIEAARLLQLPMKRLAEAAKTWQRSAARDPAQITMFAKNETPEESWQLFLAAGDIPREAARLPAPPPEHVEPQEENPKASPGKLLVFADGATPEEVDNLGEASDAVRKRVGKGAGSTGSEAWYATGERVGHVYNDQGAFVANVSYNGRVWSPGPRGERTQEITDLGRPEAPAPAPEVAPAEEVEAVPPEVEAEEAAAEPEAEEAPAPAAGPAKPAKATPPSAFSAEVLKVADKVGASGRMGLNRVYLSALYEAWPEKTTETKDAFFGRIAEVSKAGQLKLSTVAVSGAIDQAQFDASALDVDGRIVHFLNEGG